MRAMNSSLSGPMSRSSGYCKPSSCSHSFQTSKYSCRRRHHSFASRVASASVNLLKAKEVVFWKR
eukprot:2961999-Heterocapsa_arctica.AAC.1